MSTSRSGAGGKIVANRRKQRLSATPYDRPPPPPPPPESPNWFTGIVVPSARFIASGAGKLLNTIFSESESSSSSEDDHDDEGSASEDDADNEIQYDGDGTLIEKNAASSEIMHYGQESQLSVWSETKWTIEQLIMRETFSRGECDRLIKVLHSRVVEGERNLLAGSPGKMVNHEDVDIYDKAVQEAKKWFQEKKVGSSSVTELAHGTSILNSAGLGHVETGGGSPVDVARSYMKERPPWASPTRNVQVRTPLTATMKLFKEGTSYSVGQDSFSSSKKRISGSWNIQEELRRVRSKATDDMLRTPSAKIDTSLFAVAPTRVEFLGAGEVVFGSGERTSETEFLRKTKPVEALVDAGVSSDPVLAALESRLDGKASEVLSSKPVTSVSRNNEDSEAVLVDGECAASKVPQPTSPNNAEERHTGPSLSNTNGVSATEVTEIGGKQIVNGLSSSQASLSAGVAMGQMNEQHVDENHNADTVNEKQPSSSKNVEGNCALLSEAYMEVPIVTETDSIASGSQSSLGMQYEELGVNTAQPSLEEKVDIVAGKQQGRKSGKNNRRVRGRGK